MNTNHIRISAAVIVDPEGRTLLVRKSGTQFFMQPGGKIDGDESPIVALKRELQEELEVTADADELHPLGTFSAVAANEDNHQVVADLFLLNRAFFAQPASEIAEAIWIQPAAAKELTLAPLTRDHVLPMLDSMNTETQ
ncbi:MAG: NUDIX domain-containing protein [Pseudomonadota bacterium]